jgi:hypothetical protein
MSVVSIYVECDVCVGSEGKVQVKADRDGSTLKAGETTRVTLFVFDAKWSKSLT